MTTSSKNHRPKDYELERCTLQAKQARTRESSGGFTIIELIIAATVFSTVLLLASNAVIQIGRLYYKGIINSRTQETTRMITEDVSRSVQLTRGDLVGPISLPSGSGTGWSAQKAYCKGGDRFTYKLNSKVEGDAHALWVDSTPTTGCQPANYNESGGRELLSDNMRLTKFSITTQDGGGSYSIAVGVAYGDNDLLTSYKVDGTGGPNNENELAASLCRGGAGSSFCSVVNLQTIVKARTR